MKPGQSVRTLRIDCPRTEAADTLSLYRECPSGCGAHAYESLSPRKFNPNVRPHATQTCVRILRINNLRGALATMYTLLYTLITSKPPISHSESRPHLA